MRAAHLALALLLAAAPAAAEPRRDAGGSVLLRAAEIAVLEATGTPREIRGECLSACTMYLGLSTACFGRGARLGFHGPRMPGGLPMPPAAFEMASRLMAAHYPPRIAAWFLAEGRHVPGMVMIPASVLIERGEARPCPRRPAARP
jgi:hypothetical protein